MALDALLIVKAYVLKKRGILQSMEIKEPLDIDYDNIPVADLVEKLNML